MPPAFRPTFVASSILDRLLDDDPRTSVEPETATLYDVKRHKKSVARDLESLLNTRCVLEGDGLLDPFPLSKQSLLDFGITDLSSLSLLNTDDRLYLEESIREAIERHEPRITKVHVILDISKEFCHVLKFRVDGVLRVHPSMPSVSFDAMLQLSSSTYQVKVEK